MSFNYVKITFLLENACDYHIKMKYGEPNEIKKYFNHLYENLIRLLNNGDSPNDIINIISDMKIYEKKDYSKIK